MKGDPTRRARAAVLPALALLLGCAQGVSVEGPQLARPPEGFGMVFNCHAARLPIMSRPLWIQRCYAEALAEPPEWITISQHEGSLSEAEIRAEHEAYVRQWTGDSATFSDLVATRVDGRPAWYRYEYGADGRPRACTLLLSYDDACFSVEFEASRPEWRDEARLRDVACSFTRTRPGRVAQPVVLGLAVAGLAGAGWIFSRRHRREQERARLAAEVKARYQARAQAKRGPAPSPPAGPPPGRRS